MIKIICVGKLKEDYLKEGINDYIKRINKYTKIELIEIKDSNIEDEEKEILRYINNKDYIISLCIEGYNISSRELADKIDKTLINYPNISFIIGGSDGLGNKIKELSNYKLSFSKMTFPHGLFRLILLEQIYRVFKILNNETYHK